MIETCGKNRTRVLAGVVAAFSLTLCGPAKAQTRPAPAIVILLPPTATILTGPSPTISVYGQSLNFGVDIVPTSATGTVTLKDSGTTIGTATLQGGQAAFFLNLPVGAHPLLTATYSGDSTHAGSTSLPQAHNVVPALTTVSLIATPSSPTAGTLVHLTAVVAPVAPGAGTPTGSVTLTEGASAFGTLPLSGGAAVFSLNGLTAGTHLLGIAYHGDSNFVASASPSTLPIKPAALTETGTSVTSKDRPAVYGQSVSLVAIVSPASATGTVQFTDSGALLGSRVVSGGIATLSTSSLSVGTHNIAASYAGDSQYAASSSSILNFTVDKAPTKSSLTASPNPVTVAGSLTLTATTVVAAPGAGVPTGTVTFTDQATGANAGTVTLVSGHASVHLVINSAAPHTYRAIYNGDANFASSASASATYTVTSTATTITTAHSVNPAVYGQPVTFSAIVSPAAATGKVQFTSDGSTPLGTPELSNGTASVTFSSLAAGSHTLTANYGGDGTYSGSTGNYLLVVNKASTSATLVNATNPVTDGDTASLTATVTAVTPGAGSPTGTVVLMVAGQTFESRTLNASGQAVFNNFAFSSPGTVPLAIAYQGDGNFNVSTSPVLTVTIRAATLTPTSTALTGSSPTVNYIQPVTLTARVTPPAATGTVDFKEGSFSIASKTVVGGTATADGLILTPGLHNIVATYSGDAAHQSSSSAPLTVTVKVQPGISLSSSPNPSQAGQEVTFFATVGSQTPGSPTYAGASVKFLDGGTSLGSGITDAAGRASVTTSSLTPGPHNITAEYAGDSLLNGATSAILLQTVASAAKLSSKTVLDGPGSSVAGQSATFTVSVSAAAASASVPGGSVQLLDAGVAVATANLSGGTARFTTAALPAGQHTLAAVYAGDAVFNGSSSAAIAFSVSKAASGVTLTSSLNPSEPGQTVVFTARIGGSATGTVRFLDGGALLGSAPLDSSGAAVYGTSSLAAGAHAVTAVYDGDANLSGSSSAVLVQTVASAGKLSTPTSLALTASPGTPVFGQPVTFTATLSAASQSGGQPSGPVQLLEGSALVATAALNGSAAQFTLSSLNAGAHSLTAAYPGDASFGPSVSPAIAVNVSKATATVTIASSVNPSSAGQPVSFTAAVSAAAPATGTVQFTDGGAALGSAAVSGGSASLRISSLPAGAHQILATYSGDDNFSAGVSVALLQTVTSAPVNPSLPTITSVNTAGAGNEFAQNTWIEIKGTNLTPADTLAAGAIWSAAPEVASGRMPTQLGDVSVTVNGKPAYVYFVCSAATSPVCTRDQINVLTPLDVAEGPVEIRVTNGASRSAPYTVSERADAPSFLLFGSGKNVVATHADGSLAGPADLYPGLSAPAQPGETIVLYAVGFGLPATPLVEGSSTQAAALFSPPLITIGGLPAVVPFAGLIAPGLYQLNVVVPGALSAGDHEIVATYAGLSTPAGDRIAVR